ncbi:MAG: serine hydrolase [Dethiosulfatibacter sp.]|nr:serine hydrolase [Dethiosulfatibacter sp.]
MDRNNIGFYIMTVLFCLILGACNSQSDIGSLNTDDFFTVSEDDDKADNIAKFDNVLQLINDWVEDGEIVGAQLLVIENRNILIHESYGWMDKEMDIPMKYDTIFRIRSMTKPITGTAALMLVEQGMLNLSDPVSKHLGSFDNDKSGMITIGHLITHTGGFGQPGCPKDFEDHGSLREVVDDIGTAGPEVEPGTMYRYSDAGVAVLGAVIAEVTGMPVEEFIQKNIFTPLNMTDTFCTLDSQPDKRSRISATYLRMGDGYVKYWDNSKPPLVPYFRASGGVYSTTLDYAKFLYMWLNDGKIDSKQYISEQMVSQALQPNGFSNNYGYLWEVDSAFGHGGSDGTIGFVIPNENIIVLYFTQSRSTHTVEVVKADVLKEFGLSEVVQHDIAIVDPSIYQDYAGKYQHPQIILEVTTDGEHLYLKTPDTSSQLFYPASEDFFFHEVLDIQLTFVKDLDGKTTGMIIHQNGEDIEADKIQQ